MASQFVATCSEGHEHGVRIVLEGLHQLPAGAALEEMHGKLESPCKISKLRDALHELDEAWDQV